MGAITWLANVSYDQGPISMVIPIKYKGTVTLIAGVSALILFCWNGIQQKSKNVTGGSVQQTLDGKFAEPGTQNLVDQTVLGSINSGETVTYEERQAVKTLIQNQKPNEK